MVRTGPGQTRTAWAEENMLTTPQQVFKFGELIQHSSQNIINIIFTRSIKLGRACMTAPLV